MSTRILLVEDDERLAKLTAEYLRKNEFEVTIEGRGDTAEARILKEDPELVMLDVMLPGKDGFEVCREIRQNSMVPIIMVTARGEDFEKIMGLDIGADDYIVKPFSAGEVMARVRATLRRMKMEKQTKNNFTIDNLVIDLDEYNVAIDGQKMNLTKKEVELLWTLAKNKNKVFTRENLLDSIWGYDYFGDSRTVDSHIKRLRAKLEIVPHEKWDIKTIWGVGYRFEEN